MGCHAEGDKTHSVLSLQLCFLVVFLFVCVRGEVMHGGIKNTKIEFF